jgi:hypothetical protein
MSIPVTPCHVSSRSETVPGSIGFSNGVFPECRAIRPRWGQSVRTVKVFWEPVPLRLPTMSDPCSTVRSAVHSRGGMYVTS